MSLLERYEQLLANPNVQSLLNVIRSGEGTDSDDGYQVQFTGRRFNNSFRDHPRQVMRGGGYASDAAGAYQFLSTTWDERARRLGLKDFSPRSQDLAALDLIENKRGVSLDQIAREGVTPEAIHRLAPEWASLPTKAGRSHYGQPVKDINTLMARAKAGGGTFSTGASSPAQPRESAVDRALQDVFGGATQSLGSENLSGQALPGLAATATPRMAAEVFGAGWNTGPVKSSFSPSADAVNAISGGWSAPDAAPTLPSAPRFSGEALTLGDQSRSAAPAGAAPRGGQVPFQRSVSTSFDRGQPGIDLYFEDKQFRALMPGRIKDIGYQGSGRGATGKGYGNYVVKESIDPATGEKVDVLYGHLDDINVTVGQEVPEGFSIGRQGGTGRVLSQDGTIASVDFLAPAPAGSGSMTPYRHFDPLRRRLAKQWSR
ncbi:MAG: peptidoglycan DD-metalloendopeptidase family protein [Cyanobium sp.]|nr:peptidoglycan DD-metalloendopeptidase family protein [Cyanobium sp.]